MSAALYVRGVGLWPTQPLAAASSSLQGAAAALSTHGVAGSGAAESGAAGSGVARSALKPAAALLPARMRGRASPLTLMLAEVAEHAARGAGLSLDGMPSVFGSAYGEMNTTATLLSQLWAAGGQLSPAKFQASVHNTAAAQLSIALHNSSFTTSIAAGHDTVAMCLVEASAWLARHPGQVLVAFADEAPTAALQPAAAYPPLAAAFVLDNVAQRGLARIRLHLSDAEAVEQPSLKNPVSSAIELAQAVLHVRESLRASTLAVSASYRVSVEPVVSGKYA